MVVLYDENGLNYRGVNNIIINVQSKYLFTLCYKWSIFPVSANARMILLDRPISNFFKILIYAGECKIDRSNYWSISALL